MSITYDMNSCCIPLWKQDKPIEPCSYPMPNRVWELTGSLTQAGSPVINAPIAFTGELSDGHSVPLKLEINGNPLILTTDINGNYDSGMTTQDADEILNITAHYSGQSSGGPAYLPGPAFAASDSTAQNNPVG
jgi:hypothetical protein